MLWSHPSVGGSITWLVISSMIFFPKLALGLSGFETGVVVMPLVKSDVDAPRDEIKALHATRVDDGELPPNARAHLEGRIRNGKKLLAGAAIIMKLLRDNGMDAAKDVTFLSVGDGGPAARVAALSSGVIHATMFTPPSDKISEKSGMSILSRLDVANIGGGINTTPGFIQKNRPQALRFLRGYMEGIHYLKANKDESLKIFSKYVRNPDLGIMAYLYEEISTRAEKDLRPHPESMRAMLDLAALDFPQVKKLSEKDNWDLSLIDEIQRSGFLEQLYKK